MLSPPTSQCYQSVQTQATNRSGPSSGTAVSQTRRLMAYLYAFLTVRQIRTHLVYCSRTQSNSVCRLLSRTPWQMVSNAHHFKSDVKRTYSVTTWLVSWKVYGHLYFSSAACQYNVYISSLVLVVNNSLSVANKMFFFSWSEMLLLLKWHVSVIQRQQYYYIYSCVIKREDTKNHTNDFCPHYSWFLSFSLLTTNSRSWNIRM